MAGKKKKKLAVNPARGVATVSIPSKPKVTAVDAGTSSGVDQSPPSESVSIRLESSKAHDNEQQDPDIAKMTPEQLEAHLEEEELHSFVEKNSATVKLHAARHALKLQNERRQLRAYADRAFVTGSMDNVMSDVLQMESRTEPERVGDAHSSSVDEYETLLKLWTLQEVLIRLKMPFIDDALDYALSCHFQSGKGTVDHVAGLAEVWEWYAGHLTSTDLPDYETGIVSATIEHEMVEEEDVSNEVAEDNSVDLNVQSQNDHHESTNELPPEYDLIESDEIEESDDPAVLTERWLALQMLSYKIERYEKTNNYQRQKQKITQKLATISRDMLFDVQAADEQWQPIRRDLDIQAAQERQQRKKDIKNNISPVEETDTELAGPDLMLGDMFDTEEPAATARGNAHSDSTIKIKDFGEWSGLHPRRTLEDIFSKSQDSNGLKFVPLQVTTYSARLRLTLSWKCNVSVEDAIKNRVPDGVQFDSKHRAWTFTMESIAAVKSLQAEAFLSTTALFMLDCERQNATKPSTLLPKLWRDMYMDLRDSLQEARTKEAIEQTRNLQKLIRNNSHNAQPQTPLSRGGKSEAGQPGPTLDTKVVPGMLQSTKAILELWQARVGSPSFQKMQPVRQNLPVFAYKETILRTSEQNQIILVCADTGAGKSTQIPSYILENGLSQGNDVRILVTQPRRISAISIARRVSEELGEDRNSLGTSRSLVGYAIRLESKISASTRLTFATTGVLLRMLQDSFDLDQYDCLILDEVHERTMDLDLLFIALKRVQTHRPNLRIILMSATVEIEKFSAYFDNCPVLQIPGRTFPVEIGFLEDAIEETLNLQASSADAQDIEERPSRSDSDEDELTSEYVPNAIQYSTATLKLLNEYDHSRIDYQLILKLATAIATFPKYEWYSKAILIFMPGLAEIRRLNNILSSAKTFSSNWTIHMLHSSFSTQDLEQAFIQPPPRWRKIVIATNIAETGITIPDVTAVIDSCKEKIMRFDERRQLSRLTEGLISRSSARQRRGRAARVQNGICFHLIPKHSYDHKIPEQSTPEMLRLSLQQTLLRIKIWDLGSIEEVLSAAIDPPTTKNIYKAISKLKDVGAINSVECLTPLGKMLAKLPLDVALGKLAIYGVLFRSLDAAVTIIAIISAKSIFTDSQTARDYSQSSFYSPDSDLMTTYNIYCGWRKACNSGIGQQFCRNQHLSYPQLLQVEEQKVQLLVYLSDAGLISLDQREKSELSRARSLKRSVAEFDILMRYNQLKAEDVMAGVIAVAFYPKILRRDVGSAYRNVYTNQHLQLAPLSREKSGAVKLPRWLCYMEAIQVKSGKLNVLNSSRITEPLMIALLGDADFNFFAGVITIDNGNIRIALRQWKEMLAFKRLREQFRKVINGFLINPKAVVYSDYEKSLDLIARVLEKAP